MLIWSGAALSIVGMIGIIISIVLVARAKRAKLEDAEMRARISKILPGKRACDGGLWHHRRVDRQKRLARMARTQRADCGAGYCARVC